MEIMRNASGGCCGEYKTRPVAISKKPIVNRSFGRSRLLYSNLRILTKKTIPIIAATNAGMSVDIAGSVMIDGNILKNLPLIRYLIKIVAPY
jgi:hypothetical protein